MQMAKADVRVPDMPWKERIGQAVQAAVDDVFETNDIAARTLGVDASEFGKWMNGARRPQFDLLFAHGPLGKRLALRLAELAGGILVERIEWRHDGRQTV
jgi:hypothetical protein